MATFKEKILSMIGGGFMLGGFGLIKGLTKSLSHDTRVLSKVESSHFERHTPHQIHQPSHSTPPAEVASYVSHVAQPAIIRSTIHGLPPWAEIFGGEKTLVVSPIQVEPVVSPSVPAASPPPKPVRPLFVDLRQWDNKITSQGQEGSCTAYATVAAMENELNQISGEKIKLSEKSLWSMYKKPHIASAIKSAQGESRTFVAIKSFNGVTLKKDTWFAYIDNPAAIMAIENTSQILDLVAAGHPVILATTVSESFDKGVKGWIDPDSASTETGHTVTVVGYNLDMEKPQASYFIIRNSWGTKWGDRGYGYLPIHYCQKFHCAAYAPRNVRLVNRGGSPTNPSLPQMTKLITDKTSP